LFQAQLLIRRLFLTSKNPFEDLFYWSRLRPIKVRASAFEVEAGRDLPVGLVERIAQFMVVYFGYNIERGHFGFPLLAVRVNSVC